MSLKKLILITILGMAVVSCELLNPGEWKKTEQYRKERGEKCYRYSSGYIHCEDRDGNSY